MHFWTYPHVPFNRGFGTAYFDGPHAILNLPTPCCCIASKKHNNIQGRATKIPHSVSCAWTFALQMELPLHYPHNGMAKLGRFKIGMGVWNGINALVQVSMTFASLRATLIFCGRNAEVSGAACLKNEPATLLLRATEEKLMSCADDFMTKKDMVTLKRRHHKDTEACWQSFLPRENHVPAPTASVGMKTVRLYLPCYLLLHLSLCGWHLYCLHANCIPSCMISPDPSRCANIKQILSWSRQIQILNVHGQFA